MAKGYEPGVPCWVATVPHPTATGNDHGDAREVHGRVGLTAGLLLLRLMP